MNKIILSVSTLMFSQIGIAGVGMMPIIQKGTPENTTLTEASLITNELITNPCSLRVFNDSAVRARQIMGLSPVSLVVETRNDRYVSMYKIQDTKVTLSMTLFYQDEVATDISVKVFCPINQ